MTSGGTTLVLKVPTMGKFLEAELGKPSWGMSKQLGTPVKPERLPKATGIIAYRGGTPTATFICGRVPTSLQVPNQQIDDLQRRLLTTVDGTALLLSQAIFTEVGLSDLPSWVLSEQVPKFSDAAVRRVTDSELQISGMLANRVSGVVRVTLSVRHRYEIT